MQSTYTKSEFVRASLAQGIANKPQIDRFLALYDLKEYTVQHFKALYRTVHPEVIGHNGFVGIQGKPESAPNSVPEIDVVRHEYDQMENKFLYKPRATYIRNESGRLVLNPARFR